MPHTRNVRRHSDSSVEPFPPPDYNIEHDHPQPTQRRSAKIDPAPHSPNLPNPPHDVRRPVYVVRKNGDLRPGFVERCTTFVTRRTASLFDTYFTRFLASSVLFVVVLYPPPYIPIFLALILLMRTMDMVESIRMDVHAHYQVESPATIWRPPQVSADGMANFKFAFKQKTQTPAVHRLDNHTGF